MPAPPLIRALIYGKDRIFLIIPLHGRQQRPVLLPIVGQKDTARIHGARTAMGEAGTADHAGIPLFQQDIAASSLLGEEAPILRIQCVVYKIVIHVLPLLSSGAAR